MCKPVFSERMCPSANEAYVTQVCEQEGGDIKKYHLNLR